MTATTTGRLQRTTITLDARVPVLDGRRVRVVLEPAEDPDMALTPQAQAAIWQAWVDHGPQGPIEDEDEPEFP